MKPVFFSVGLIVLAGLSAAAASLAQETSAGDRQRAIAQFRAGQEAARSEDFTGAETSFKAAIETDPRFAAAHCALGQLYMSLRRYADAIQALTECKTLTLDEAQRRTTEAAADDQQLQRDVQELRDEIHRMEALAVNDASRQADVVKLEGRLSQLEQQRRHETPRVVVPAEISFALGTAYLRNGSLENAEREYLGALKVRPDYGDAHNNLAVVYMGLGAWEKAEAQVKAAEQAGFHVSPQMRKDLETRQLTMPVSPPAATVLTPPPAEAVALSIEHAALTCVLDSQYPRIEARITPAESVQRAWVRFKSDEKGGYYAVPLRREGDIHVGVLPRPKWLKGFEYYVEAVNQNAESSRTPEYSPVVVGNAKECGARRLSTSVADALNLIIEKPPGASPRAKLVPPGFSSHGTAGGIGAFDWSARTTALVAAGIVGTVVGATVSLKGEEPGTGGSPVDIFNVFFRSSMPPPGSRVSVGQGSLTIRVNIQQTAIFGPNDLRFIRVDFFGTGSSHCISIMTPAHPPTGLSEDFTVSGPLATGCSLPFTATQVTASLLSDILAPVRGTSAYPLDVAYTFVP